MSKMENRSHASRIRSKEEIENALKFLHHIRKEILTYNAGAISPIFKEHIFGMIFALEWALKKENEVKP